MNGWDTPQQTAAGPGAQAATANDPVAGFEFRRPHATDADFVESVHEDHVDDAHVIPEEEHAGEVRPRKKSSPGLLLAMGGVVLVMGGGMFMAAKPALQAFGLIGAPQEVTAKPRLTLPADEHRSASAANAPASASVAAASAPASAPSAVASSPATAEPAPVQIAASAPSPANPATSAAVAAVLADARKADPVPAAAAPAAPAPAAVAPVAPATPVLEAKSAVAAPVAAKPLQPAKVASPIIDEPKAVAMADKVVASGAPHASPSGGADVVKPASTTQATREARAHRHAAPPRRASASTEVAVAPRPARKVVDSAKKPKAESASVSTASASNAEQVVGYTLLAIQPRQGEFQQAWVRDPKGVLTIVSPGDRVGGLQVIRIDGKRGEVLTAAGVIR